MMRVHNRNEIERHRELLKEADKNDTSFPVDIFVDSDSAALFQYGQDNEALKVTTLPNGQPDVQTIFGADLRGEWQRRENEFFQQMRQMYS